MDRVLTRHAFPTSVAVHVPLQRLQLVKPTNHPSGTVTVRESRRILEDKEFFWKFIKRSKEEGHFDSLLITRCSRPEIASPVLLILIHQRTVSRCGKCHRQARPSSVEQIRGQPQLRGSSSPTPCRARSLFAQNWMSPTTPPDCDTLRLLLRRRHHLFSTLFVFNF